MGYSPWGHKELDTTENMAHTYNLFTEFDTHSVFTEFGFP